MDTGEDDHPYLHGTRDSTNLVFPRGEHPTQLTQDVEERHSKTPRYYFVSPRVDSPTKGPLGHQNLREPKR